MPLLIKINAATTFAGFRRLQSGPRSPFPTRVGLNLADARHSAPRAPSARRRDHSSSSSDEEQASTSSDGERRWTLVYHRDPSRSTQPRALLGVGSFNLAYWTWYVADFTPAINASARSKAALGQIDAETLDMLLVDPNMGYVGLGVASVIWTGAFLYSRQLVSAIWAPADAPDDARSALAVSTLKLPFLTRPDILGRTAYDPEDNPFDRVENIAFQESELRSEGAVEFYAPGELTLSEEQRKNDAVVKFDGNFGKLRGHLPVKRADEGPDGGMLSNLRQQRYLLDVESELEVVGTRPTLLNSLVLDDYHLRELRKAKRRESSKRRRGSRRGRR